MTWTPPNPAHYHVTVDAQHKPTAVRAAVGTLPARPVELSMVPEDLWTVIERAAEVPDGQGAVTHGDLLWRFRRLSRMGGDSYVVVPTGEPPPDLETLGVPAPFAGRLLALGHKAGLIVVLGDFNAGKTTLAVTLLTQFLKRHAGTAVAYMDPPEYKLQGAHGDGYCDQVQIGPEDYDRAALAVKQSRADFVLFGEPKTAGAMFGVMQVALSGPTVIMTAHGDSLVNGLTALQSLVLASDPTGRATLASALLAVLHLRVTPGVDRRTGTVIDALMLGDGENGGAIRAVIRGDNMSQVIHYIEHPTERRR